MFLKFLSLSIYLNNIIIRISMNCKKVTNIEFPLKKIFGNVFVNIPFFS